MQSKQFTRHQRSSSSRSKTSPGYESEYEDNEGNLYGKPRNIGEGSFAKARSFATFDGKEIVVLQPIYDGYDSEDAEQSTAKEHFFNLMYPDGPVERIELEKGYRLILPKIPGKDLDRMDKGFWTEKNKIDLFISIIHALQKVHEKKLIMIDLNAGNIKYEQKTGACYLIDGGSSKKIGEAISNNYLCGTLELLKDSQKQYMKTPPECWYLPDSNPLPAEESMDVYSLAALFKGAPNYALTSLPIASLLSTCLSMDPLRRPSLEYLLHAFTKAKSHYEADLQTVSTLLSNASLGPSCYHHLIKEHPITNVLFNLNTLKEYHLVTQNNLKLLNTPNIDLSSMTDLLILLKKMGFPNTPALYKELIGISLYLNRSKFNILSESITLLYQAQLLTLPNFIAAAKEDKLNDVLNALLTLLTRGLLNKQASQSDLDPMLSYPNHQEAAIVWGLLRTAGLSYNYQKVMSRPDLNEFVLLLKVLENSDLLNENNLEWLLKDQHPKILVRKLVDKKYPFWDPNSQEQQAKRYKASVTQLEVNPFQIKF